MKTRPVRSDFRAIDSGHTTLRCVIFIGLICLPMNTLAQSRTHIDWPRFMQQHNLTWDTLSTDWYTGAFIGNGLAGAMIYRDGKQALRWDIGRSDVVDNRTDMDVEWGKSRLPIGHFRLVLCGQIRQSSMELDLWNAEARGQVITSLGTVRWRSFVATQPSVLIAEISASRGEHLCRWEWVPDTARSPRLLWNQKSNQYTPSLNAVYAPPPPATSKQLPGLRLHTQPLFNGGSFTTAWSQQRTVHGAKDYWQHRTIYVSIGYSTRTNQSKIGAVRAFDEARRIGVNRLVHVHRNWWHRFYKQSFVSIPDKRLESYYWIQQYKLASATRANRAVLDLLGPWYHSTPWPALWWNLNVQLTYSPVYSSNHLALGESLCNTLDSHVAELIQNVPEPYRHDAAGISRVSSYDCRAILNVELPGLHQKFKEAGNLTWAMHNYWMQCRYAADHERMKSRLFPLLRRSINYYRHLLQEQTDKRLHLPPTYSPEYTDELYADCNYDLSLLRWGCQTLLKLNQRYALHDTLAPFWQDVLVRLTPYPVDSTGLMIGRNTPLAFSHRHYSHLLMIYPLQLISPATDRDLITRSLRYWTGQNGALQGYTFTGAASIAALMGDGNGALHFLNSLLDRYTPPNTFYREAGPVLETPFSAVTSVNEMLLQCRDSVVHVFPSVPDTWLEASFYNLRTEGAYLISAQRKGGKTQCVNVYSLAGEKIDIQVDIPTDRIQLRTSHPSAVKRLPNGRISVHLPIGGRLLISGLGIPILPISPVRHPDNRHFFGLHKLSKNQFF